MTMQKLKRAVATTLITVLMDAAFLTLRKILNRA